jgi:uracil-DNA glycosylase family 4
MPEQQHPTETDLLRIARWHAASLRAAGVEWLPAAKEPLPSPPPRQPNNTPPAPSPPAVIAISQESLFQEKLPAVGGPEQRRHELQVLATRVAGCLRCAALCSTRTQTVFGVGPIDPELCFIGEAPGADEDRLGEPFVGAAGQLLNRILAACGLKREEVYICNILRCRPPGNRTPAADEAANCREYLEKQLELVRPKFICALGGSAAQNLLNTTESLGRLRRRFHDYRGIPVLCTYHPAFLLPHRSPEKKKDVWEDMKLLLAKMGRSLPPK